MNIFDFLGLHLLKKYLLIGNLLKKQISKKCIYKLMKKIRQHLGRGARKNLEIYYLLLLDDNVTYKVTFIAIQCTNILLFFAEKNVLIFRRRRIFGLYCKIHFPSIWPFSSFICFSAKALASEKKKNEFHE